MGGIIRLHLFCHYIYRLIINRSPKMSEYWVNYKAPSAKYIEVSDKGKIGIRKCHNQTCEILIA